MDKPAGMGFVEAHGIEVIIDLLETFLPILGKMVNVDALGNDIRHGHPGIQRRIRILEDDLRLLLKVVFLAAGHLMDVLAPIEHLAVGFIVQAQNNSSAGGLTAAGFAHQAHRLPFIDVKGYVVQCLYHLFMAGIKVLFQVLYLYQRLLFRFHGQTSFPACSSKSLMPSTLGAIS